jgi:hypothetical protein
LVMFTTFVFILALCVLSVARWFYRKAYMKRLDNPSNSLCSYLLNIKKTPQVQAKNTLKINVADCLASKTLFHYLTVYKQSGGKIR